MLDQAFSFEEPLWATQGNAAWHFVTLPLDVADQIRFQQTTRRGFGSVPVVVTIGGSRWRTSVFPDKKSGSYFLPIKASVRKAEGLAVGTPCAIALRLVGERL